ncbi:uncharacterized protein [Anabrus simplex]|uniref:uncharacterized protein n=1 Tax=Anabrus simplex TaxID=316456 RepID=UPI0035A30BBA
MSSSKTWSKEETMELVHMYECHKELWDVKSLGYKNRVKKLRATSVLANHFKTTRGEITRKLHNLRSQMWHELKKIKSRKSGDGSEEVYQSTWPYFDAMKFIISGVPSRPTAESLAERTLIGQGTRHMGCDKSDMFQVDTARAIKRKPAHLSVKDMDMSRRGIACCISQDVSHHFAREFGVVSSKTPRPSTSTEPNVPSTGEKESPRPQCFTKKRLREDDDDVMLQKAVQMLQQPPDIYQIFGDYIASEMRSLHFEENRRKLKRVIQRAILEISEVDDSMLASRSQYASHSQASSPAPSPLTAKSDK